MHRFVAGTCRIEIDLIPRSTWMIKGETRDVGKDRRKTFPLIDADNRPVLPGTSIKGVMRSTAEHILRAIQPNRPARLIPLADATFGTGDKESLTNMKRGNIADSDLNEWRARASGEPPLGPREIYSELSPASQLFGSTLHASNLTIDDTRASNTTTVERTHVAIDRDTSAAHKGGLFTEILAPPGKSLETVALTIENFAFWQIALIGLVLREIDRGYTAFGYGTRKGQGQMRTTVRGIRFKYTSVVYKPRRTGVISPQGWLATQTDYPLTPRDTPDEVAFEAGLTLLPGLAADVDPPDWRDSGHTTLTVNDDTTARTLLGEALTQAWYPWLREYGVEVD